MKRIKSLQVLFICIITSILCFNCGGGGGSTDDKPDGNAQFLSFSINGLDGVIVDTNISVVLPSGTDISSLVATFTIKGVSVKVNDVEQQSGITINNYSAPVEYVVYSENGTSVKYTITVTVASSSSKEITAFSINGISGSITGSSIGLTLPYGTNVNNLIASFSSTGNSVTVNGTMQVSGSSSNNL